MTTIEHEIFAKCSTARLWALLANLEGVNLYNSGVKSAVIDGELRKGVGARRTCELVPNGRVVERVTLWEEGVALGFEVAQSDWPIHFMRWVTKVEPHRGGTRVTQKLEYQVKFGPLGWLLDRIMMRRQMTKTLDGVLASLVQHAESSSGVSEKGTVDAIQ